MSFRLSKSSKNHVAGHTKGIIVGVYWWFLSKNLTSAKTNDLSRPCPSLVVVSEKLCDGDKGALGESGDKVERGEESIRQQKNMSTFQWHQVKPGEKQGFGGFRPQIPGFLLPKMRFDGVHLQKNSF